jgi:hypothetical protein
VKGSWGTKIENIIRKIFSIVTKEKDAKILIFSQWNDVLILMGRALQENQIQYVDVVAGGKKKFHQVYHKIYASMHVLCVCMFSACVCVCIYMCAYSYMSPNT